MELELTAGLWLGGSSVGTKSAVEAFKVLLLLVGIDRTAVTLVLGH